MVHMTAYVDKIADTGAITDLAASARSAGRRVVLTNGCFDVLHHGHITLLLTAASFGDLLIVAMNSDTSVRQLKGRTRPLIPQVERVRSLAALTCVDQIVVFDQETPIELIRRVRPDVLVKGGDYRVEQVVGYADVQRYGGEVRIVPLVPGISSSLLIEARAASES